MAQLVFESARVGQILRRMFSGNRLARGGEVRPRQPLRYSASHPAAANRAALTPAVSSPSASAFDQRLWPALASQGFDERGRRPTCGLAGQRLRSCPRWRAPQHLPRASRFDGRPGCPALSREAFLMPFATLPPSPRAAPRCPRPGHPVRVRSDRRL
jgi:hypothetical protein